jgi:hypothetical protein
VQKRRGKPQSLEEIAERLQALAPDAVAVLHVSLFEGSPSTRIRAAEAILNLGTIASASRAFEIRLSELERLKWKK